MERFGNKKESKMKNKIFFVISMIMCIIATEFFTFDIPSKAGYVDWSSKTVYLILYTILTFIFLILSIKDYVIKNIKENGYIDTFENISKIFEKVGLFIDIIVLLNFIYSMFFLSEGTSQKIFCIYTVGTAAYLGLDVSFNVYVHYLRKINDIENNIIKVFLNILLTLILIICIVFISLAFYYFIFGLILWYFKPIISPS